MCEALRLHAVDPEVKDPSPDKWVRKDFPNAQPRSDDDVKRRSDAELSLDRDMEKPVQQIATDFHEHIYDEEPGTPERTTLEAQARMVSMMASVSIASHRLGTIVKRLTYVLVTIGLATLVLQVISLACNK